MSKRLIIFIFVLVVLLGIWVFQSIDQYVFAPTDSSIDQGVAVDQIQDPDRETTKDADSDQDPQQEPIEVVYSGFDIPWELAFDSEHSFLVTERPGRLTHINDPSLPFANRQGAIQEVVHVGEGGLLGMALHPDFEENQWLYLYLTTETDDGLVNRVERYQYSSDGVKDKQPVLEGIPGAKYHDGGRMAFGPDEKLYITTGDATQESLAQDISSLAGKILRLNPDGSIPEDNPFGNAVWSYGHRNPQGLAWDHLGRLWATEHGPSGLQSGFDELNLIEKGKNYGWPTIRGDETVEDMVSPVKQSGSKETWAPAGMAFVPKENGGSLFFAGLRGESLYEAPIGENGEMGELKRHFTGDFGRLRAVVLGPDSALYLSTSNTDGRGSVRKEDDKLIRVELSVFE